MKIPFHGGVPCCTVSNMRMKRLWTSLPLTATPAMNMNCIVSVKNGKTSHYAIAFGLILFLVNSPAFGDCTVGVVDQTASADGRPIAWKVRDTSFEYQQVLFSVDGKYKYIGIGKAGNSARSAAMALNDRGLALGNSLLKDIGDHRNGNSNCMRWLLENCATVEECLTAFGETIKGSSDFYPGSPTFTLPIIGSDGKAYHVECGKTEYYGYDPLDFGAEAVRKHAVVVRANQSHQNSDGSDDVETGGCRYYEGRDHLHNAVTNNGIFADDPKGGRGVTIGELIQLARIGEPYEGKGWTTHRKICSQVTVSVMLAQGIKKGEDPRIAVMWSSLGNPDYTPFVPVWVDVAAHSDLTSPLTDGGQTPGLSYQARRLYEKKDLEDYDQYVNQRLEPMEANFIQAVNQARERWVSHGFVYDEAKRICQESSRTAYQTLKTIADEAQVSNRSLNATPVLTQMLVEAGPESVSFSHNASDADGAIASVFWEFGDGQTSNETSPSHRYSSGGTYLVMCRVEDEKGSRNSIWKYVSVEKK